MNILLLKVSKNWTYFNNCIKIVVCHWMKKKEEWLWARILIWPSMLLNYYLCMSFFFSFFFFIIYWTCLTPSLITVLGFQAKQATVKLRAVDWSQTWRKPGAGEHRPPRFWQNRRHRQPATTLLLAHPDFQTLRHLWVYYSILETLGQRSQCIIIKFLLHKHSENTWVCY